MYRIFFFFLIIRRLFIMYYYIYIYNLNKWLLSDKDYIGYLEYISE